MTFRRRRRFLGRAVPPLAGVAVLSAALMSGCASRAKPVVTPETPATRPVEQLHLDELEPAVTLPATSPSTAPASADALQLYAQGRDALLTNRKKLAIEKLGAAAELEPESAIVQRDLGYALLGSDNAAAEAAFRRAIEINPTDADSRVQIARMLAGAMPRRDDEAIEQLRLARLSPAYRDADGLATVIDLLLGRLLEQKGYRLAALECYEHVLQKVDRGSIELRGRPELAELLQRPGVLLLRVADLALQAKQPERAIALYERLQKQEPQAAAVLELRMARALIDAGRVDEAVRRAFNVVEAFRAGRSARAAFARLFDELGYDRALVELGKLQQPGLSESTRDILRADLLMRAGRPAEVIETLKNVDRFDLSAARLTVHAYRAAGRDEELIAELIGRTARLPRRWPAINRAWAMLTHMSQPASVTAKEIAAATIPPEQEAARQFVLAQYWSERGQPLPARRALAEAQTRDAALVKSLLQQSEGDIDLAADYADEADLVDLLLDYRDDPELLNVIVAQLLRQGHKQQLFGAFQEATIRQPDSVTLANTYAEMLALEERKPEALAVLERVTEHVRSANELYVISARYTFLGDAAAGEQLLRKALQVDPMHPAVCNDLGYSLVDQGRELDFAETLLWRAVGAESENPAYLDSLGWLLYKRGRFAEASQYLEQAVQASDPSSPIILDHSGDALQRLGQSDAARRRWTQAVDAIKARGTSDPQLRLRIEQKLRQLDDNQKVDVAPVAENG